MSDTPTNAPAIQPKSEPKSVKDFLALPAYKSRFDEVMGKRAPQFLASITNYVNQSKQVAECDPKTVIASAFVAATLGFPVDKNLGFCWIVPYAKRASFQMGYKGYIQLALRSAQYEVMNAKPINAEAFGGFDKATGEPIILWQNVDDDKPVAGYAFAWRLTTGFVKTCYWSKAKVENHAKRFSQAYRSRKPGQPWQDNFDAMAMKTVIANELRKWGILSVDMQRAIEHDQGSQDDIDAPVKHDDNAGIFDVEASESMGSVLGDDPKADAAKSEGNGHSGQTSGVAYTEAQLKALVTEVENYALNLGITPAKLFEHAKTPSAKRLTDLPYATLQELRAWLEQKAKEATTP